MLGRRVKIAGMLEPEWVDDLPGRATRKSDSNPQKRAWLEALDQRPGVWARLERLGDVYEARTLQARLKTDGYAFSARQTGEEEWSVYGRRLTPEQQADVEADRVARKERKAGLS